MVNLPKTKAELLEENIGLLKSAIKGWARRLLWIAELGGDPIQIENIVSEMDQFSGD